MANARHAQRPDKNSNWTCEACRNLNCLECVDALRGKYIDVENLTRLCKCQHKECFSEV